MSASSSPTSFPIGEESRIDQTAGPPDPAWLDDGAPYAPFDIQIFLALRDITIISCKDTYSNDFYN